MCHRNTVGCSNIQDGTQHDWTNPPENGINTGPRHSDSGQNITPGQGPDIDSNIVNIWVRNLSKTPLTRGQEQVLAQGPNFCHCSKGTISLGIYNGHRESLSTAETRWGGGTEGRN